MTDIERLLTDTLADDAWTLPVPAGSVPQLQQAVRRRRIRGRLAVGGTAVLVAAGTAVGVSATGDGLTTRVDPLPVAGAPEAREGVVRGVVVDGAGRPLERIAVLPSDASRVLTRTGPDGVFEVACTAGLVLAPYAPSAPSAAVVERSPGAGNLAWRRLVVAEDCGGVVRVALLQGGVVEGTVPGSTGPAEVRLLRLPGTATEPGPGSLVFATRVGEDGRWRIEGLDTGRYRLGHTGQLVDVGVGRTVTLP